MGCVGIRIKTSEENLLIEEEKSLGIHLIPSQNLDTIFRKYSHLGKVNQAQLQRISATLNINIKNYDSHKHIDSMLNNLLRDSDHYLLKDLLVIGILLSEGEDKLKAALLFQAFDETLEEAIEITRLQGHVFRLMADLSVRVLGSLAYSPLIKENSKMQNYLNKCKCAENLAIRYATDNIVKDRSKQVISEEEFVNGLCSFRWGELLTPFG